MRLIEVDNVELTLNEKLALQLRGSFLSFIRVFFKLKTGRDFFISNPVGREPHVITIARALKKVFNGDTRNLLINVPPGHHKSTICLYFIAWCYANYPDCNWLYISHAYDLAEKHTSMVKEIIQMPEFKLLFGVELRGDSKAKGAFTTLQGGQMRAFGSSGAVVGMDAGLPHLLRMSGGLIIDDAHKAGDCTSDTLREAVIENYKNTIKWRRRGPNVPFIFIGQRLHENDLPNFLLQGLDGNTWETVILPGLDEAGNALYPEFMSKEDLLKELEFNPYNAAAQIQQNPQPAGGGIFKPEWFVLKKEEPNIIMTLITADTAETTNTVNDKTCFSFWGLYKRDFRGIDTGEYALHWIDCYEFQCEPKDLEAEFFSFYQGCMQHHVKPRVAAIEKKSTGVTLISVLKELQCLQILEVTHNHQSFKDMSKTGRFLACQPFVASGKVSLPEYGSHTHACIEHCRKITANDSHRWDDVADTLSMALEVTLIDKTLMPQQTSQHSDILTSMNQDIQRLNRLKSQALSPWR